MLSEVFGQCWLLWWSVVWMVK